MFSCGWYKIKWYNAKGEQVKEEEEKYLTAQLYRREVMTMQTAFLQGKDVEKMVVTPIEKK
jgi:hypothetical protein